MLKKLRELTSDSATYGLSGVLRQMISFFLLPLYTRFLTPDDYGILAMLAILSMLFVPLANLGITNAIFRRFNTVKAAEERAEVLSTGLFSVIIGSALLVVMGSIFAKTVAWILLDETIYLDLIRLSLLTSFFDSVSQVPLVILRAERRVKLAASLNIFNLLVNISLTIFFVAGLKQGVHGVIYANLVGAIITTISLFVFVLKTLRAVFNMVIWRRMLAYGLPFLPHRFLAMGMSQFGVYMISHMLGHDQAGLYSLATRLTMPLILVVNSIQQAWVPFKFQIHAEEKEPALVFRSITTYYVAGTTYLWVGVSLWGPEVIRIMTTPSFYDAALLVPFVSLIPLMQGFYFMFGTGIELSDNTRPMPLASLAGFVAAVIGAFAFIPLIDAYGAAVATMTGWLAMTVVIYIISQTRFKIHYDWLSVAGLIMSGALLAGSGLLGRHEAIGIRIAIAVLGSTLYPLMAWLILRRSTTENARIQMLQDKVLVFPRSMLGSFFSNTKDQTR